MSCGEVPIRILVVDDNQAIHEDICKSLAPRRAEQSLDAAAAELFGDPPSVNDGPHFQIDSAFQGEQACEMVQSALDEGRPYEVAFIDVRMPPGWDGIETTEQFFQLDDELQVVLCTAYSDYSISQILRRFAHTDRLLILKKPFDIAEVTLLAITLSKKWRLGRQAKETIATQNDQIVDLESVLQLVQESHSQLQSKTQSLSEQSKQLSHELQRRTVEVFETCEVAALALAQLAESRDPETGEHLARMQQTAQHIAEQLHASSDYGEMIDEVFLDNLYHATPLHDIGKVGIPDAILLKPGRLTSNEFEVMKRHTLIGARALEGLVRKAPDTTFLMMAADIAMHHHERWDGAGYPFGLQGESIPLAARIASVADVFDALTSNRVYKDAMPQEKARSLIQQGSGQQFDPVVVKAFLERFDQCVSVRERIDRPCTSPTVLI